MKHFKIALYFVITFFFYALNLFGQTTSTFTTGTATWIVPSCVSSVTVQAWGGGGGGGGVSSYVVSGSNTDNEACSAGGGGGGGGYTNRVYAVTPGDVYTVTVGAGGIGGVGSSASSAAGNGGIGGNSIFSGPATVGPGILTAFGGNYGGGALTKNNNDGFHDGTNGLLGTGGSGANGTTTFLGGNGATGKHDASCNDQSGGGGGGGGTTGVGGNATTLVCWLASEPGGIGGTSNGGSGGNGNKGSLCTSGCKSVNAGNAGSTLGGGGSGALIHNHDWYNTWVTTNGGAGARGGVWLTYLSTTPTLTVNNASICSGQNVVLTAATANNYTWSTGATTNTISVSPSSTAVYTVTGDNGSGCTITKTATVTVNSTPTVNISGTSSICSGNSTTLTAATASNYTWSTGANTSTLSVSPISNTTYTLTGANGVCTATTAVTVTVTATPTLTISGTTILCSGQNTTLTGATATNYTWSPGGANTNTITVTPATGTTNYTLTGANGICVSTKTTSVVVNPLPTLTLTATSPTICINSNTAITASGANTYTWSPSGSLSASTGASVTASPTATTIYTVNATSAAGCTATKTVSITINPLPTLTVTASSATICAGTTSTLTASGAITYTWTPSSTLNSANGTPVVATPTTTTHYTVTGTDGNGCKNSQASTLTVNSLPNINISGNPSIICSGVSSTITATGADTYTWSPAGSLNTSTGPLVIATPSTSTIYTVVGTFTASGCVNTSTLNLTISATPSLTIGPSSNFTICLGDSTHLNVTGGTTYTWSPLGSLNSANGATVTATPTTTTIYTVSSVAGGCASSASTATITVNLPPDIAAHASPLTICAGGSTTLSATGNSVSYTWTPAATLSSATGTPVVATLTTTTDYIVTGTGANGCTNKDSVKVIVNPTPTVSISSSGGGSSQTVCSGVLVNGITFNTSAGVETIWYNTNTGIGLAASDTGNITPYTAPTVVVQQTGTITVIAIDSTTGCKSSITNSPNFTVTINPLPIISATDSLTPGGCGGLTNGCISNVAGQAPGTYQYSWNNGGIWSNNSQLCNIAAGNYTVEIKDQNGCISQKTILLPSANTPALPTISGLPTNTCAGDTVHLSINSPGPLTTYTWTSSLGAQNGTTYTINNVNPVGTYTLGLDIADSNACLNGTTLSFTVNALPHPIISGTNHFCKGTSTVLNVTPTNANYTYQWNNTGIAIAGATNTSYTATSGGSYGTILTNTLTGCKHDTLITITVDSIPATPSIITNTNNNTYCQGQSLNPITVNGTGTFTWYSNVGLTTQIGTGNPFTPSVTATGTTTIYVTVSGSVCTSDFTPVVIIINPTPGTPTITVGAGNNTYCQNINPLPAIVATGASTIVWYDNTGLTNVVNTGTSYTPTSLAPNTTTTYYLVDSSAAGCKSTGTATVSVTINPKPVINGTAIMDSSLCGKNNGAVLGLTANNGTPQYTYHWIDANGTVVGTSSNLSNIGAGTYSLIVIDANNCRDTASNGSGYVVSSSNAITAGFNASTYQGIAPLAVTFSNTSTGATAYTWSFGNNTNSSTQVNTSYTYTNAGSYVVTLVAANGHCSDTARRTIAVDEPQVIIIPNIFSPNGDDINDQFFITSSGLSTLNCDIYNRWGQLIFSIKSITQTWDGIMNNGNHATEGTYFYFLQATGLDGTDYKKNGPLTLVR